jgi:hypothetical protein
VLGAPEATEKDRKDLRVLRASVVKIPLNCWGFKPFGALGRQTRPLEGLCRALDCQPGELLEYVPE